MNARDQNSQDHALEVCRRMAALRRELSSDVEQVSESAQAMTNRITDWTFYVRRFPWAAVGVAAAAGFLLVPRKKIIVRPTPEQLETLAHSRDFVSAATGEFKPQRSMLQGLMATAATMAGRYAIAYISQQLHEAATKPARPEPEPMATAENGVNEMES